MALTVKRVARLEPRSTPYHHKKGLYLSKTSPKAKSWLGRIEYDGVDHWFGLGPLDDFPSPDDAFDMWLPERKRLKALLKAGVDPTQQKREQRAAAKSAKTATTAATKTFADCALLFYEREKSSWRSELHGAQVYRCLLGRTLTGEPVKVDYTCTIRDLPVDKVSTEHILDIVAPHWLTKRKTIDVVRNRIEGVLAWATGAKLRSGDNPASLATLKHLLPKRPKQTTKPHFEALPWKELPAFTRELRARDGVDARALEFTILTCARTMEAIRATWDELDFDERVWRLPAERMKAGRPHIQPLSAAAIDVLRALPRESKWVFPGVRPGTPLGVNAMRNLLDRLGREVTVHGFRSTFADWCHERTGATPMLVEMCLAHAFGDATQQAYARSDLTAKRRKLLEQWAAFCASPADATAVVPMRARLR